MSTVTETGDDLNPPAAIDTLGFAIRIADFDRVGCQHTINAEGTPEESHRYMRKLDGGGFVGTGVGDTAWLEASLPKRIDGDNWQAVSVDDAVHLARDLLGEACEFIDLDAGSTFDDARIVRLDLVRDFHGVDDPTPVLDGLAGVEQPGRSKVRRFADPSANRSETLRVGPRAWGCTLYDKHTETKGRAPVGQVRFEARLHRDQLSSVFAKNNGGHFTTIADLIRQGGTGTRTELYHLGAHHLPAIGAQGPWLPALDTRQAKGGRPRRIVRDGDNGAALARAQRAWFDRVGFGLACDGRNALAGRLATSTLSASRQGSLWAYLTLPGFAGNLSRNTRRKYRVLADELGFAPMYIGEDIPFIDQNEDTRSAVRLDYDLGELVAA